MSTGYLDTFTDTGGTGGPPAYINLVDHTSDSGHTYTASDVGVPKLDTDNNVLLTLPGTNQRQFWRSSWSPTTADYWSKATITVKSTADFTACGIGIRIPLGSERNGYFAVIDPNDGQFRLEKYIDGLPAVLGAPYAIDLSILPASFEVEVEAVGSDIKAYLDGVLRVSASDTEYTAPGGAGGFIRVTENLGQLSVDNASADVIVSGSQVTAADDITTEGQTATFTLSGNTAAPTSATLNGEPVGALTALAPGVYSYTAPLIADDGIADLVVRVDSTTVRTTISYTNSYPYQLTTHGEPSENSIFKGAQFATSGPVEWGVVTDYNSSIVTVDHAALDSAEDELNYVDSHATTVSAGSTTATYKYFVPESGATGSWQVTIAVGEDGGIVVSAPSARAIGFRKSIRAAVRSAVGSATH